MPDDKQPLDAQWRALAPQRPRRQVVAADRPTVVTVICVLQLVCIPLQMLILFGTSVELIIAGIQLIGLSPGIVLGIALASWGLGMISALGMWSGAKWGWWSGAFFYVYSILRTLFSLVQLGLLARHNFLDSHTLTFNVLWLVARIPVLALILILFFTDDFLAYFEAARNENIVPRPELPLPLSWPQGPRSACYY